ncbi:hypothetical protein GCM10018781_77620 [Kitasatospora indigofera]|uniref:Uncharacterized protein n=1 Tax=Kitasatospora indigofera TaxID=67307 RepID=A0A918YVE0_9ACTN|nr:hypothetical protein GCM10018781_77620 [Kitasatospora indigofera]
MPATTRRSAATTATPPRTLASDITAPASGPDPHNGGPGRTTQNRPPRPSSDVTILPQPAAPTLLFNRRALGIAAASRPHGQAPTLGGSRAARPGAGRYQPVGKAVFSS